MLLNCGAGEDFWRRLKILQARLQQYVNSEILDVQAEFRKGRGTRYQIANIHWIMEKARAFQKNMYFCFIDYAKAMLWKILQEMAYSHQLTCLLRNMYGSQEATDRTGHRTTGSKFGKEYIKAVYCHPAYVTSVQRTRCEMPDWMKHKMQSRLQEKY